MSLATLPKPETPEERFNLVRSVGEECINESDLRNLIDKKPGIRCYDGFEPSGRMHIAQGIFKSINVNKCTNSGCKFVFWVADWFALMNDKMGGEIERIRVVGKYLVEVWRAAGMDMANVEFLWSSEEINRRADEYWRIVLDIARRNTLARIKKCCTIMGKQEGTLTTAQILYPIMQCTDIFFIKADICQLGLDQRKCNMLAREYCDQIGRKLKPVILSHHMLAGLKAGQAKMSKSDPESAIFMEDTAEDVERKILAAHCPRVAQKVQEVQEDGAPTATEETNPCLDYLKCIVFSNPNASFVVDDQTFTTFETLEKAFVDGSISEEALKKALIGAINTLLEPVRAHFRDSEEAKGLLETIKGYKKEPAAPQPPKAVDLSTPRLVVFVPAVLKLHLDIALSIVEQVNAFLASTENAEAVLYLPDWSATTRNEVTGDEKEIAAILAYNVALIQSFGLNAKAAIVKQSEHILSDANGYWFEVINAGRKYMTSKVETYTGEVSCAGVLIGALMRCVDVFSLKATAILTIPETDIGQNTLACEYAGGQVKEMPLAAPAHRKLCDPNTEATTDDAFLFADDSDMDIRRKLKKAFAAEKDASNPVVGLAGRFVNGNAISLKTQNGDVIVNSNEELIEKYNSGAVHPGDLKPFVSDSVVGLYANTRKVVGTPDIKKLATLVKNAEKKLAKKK